MFTCRILEDRDQRFDNFILTHPCGHLFQSYPWGELKQSFGWRPLRLLFTTGDRRLRRRLSSATNCSTTTLCSMLPAAR